MSTAMSSTQLSASTKKAVTGNKCVDTILSVNALTPAERQKPWVDEKETHKVAFQRH